MSSPSITFSHKFMFIHYHLGVGKLVLSCNGICEHVCNSIISFFSFSITTLHYQQPNLVCLLKNCLTLESAWCTPNKRLLFVIACVLETGQYIDFSFQTVSSLYIICPSVFDVINWVICSLKTLVLSMFDFLNKVDLCL